MLKRKFVSLCGQGAAVRRQLRQCRGGNESRQLAPIWDAITGQAVVPPAIVRFGIGPAS